MTRLQRAALVRPLPLGAPHPAEAHLALDSKRALALVVHVQGGQRPYWGASLAWHRGWDTPPVAVSEWTRGMRETAYRDLVRALKAVGRTGSDGWYWGHNCKIVYRDLTDDEVGLMVALTGGSVRG